MEDEQAWLEWMSNWTDEALRVVRSAIGTPGVTQPLGKSLQGYLMGKEEILTVIGQVIDGRKKSIRIEQEMDSPK